MSKRGFPITLEDCLLRLDRGDNLPDLLRDYPEQAEELKPLLLVAMASRAFPIPVPGQTAQRLGRNQMLAEMNRLETKKAFRRKKSIPLASRLIGRLVSAARAYGFTRLAYSYRLAMVALVVILSGGFFTVNASASSQPGDLLYPLRIGLKRAGLTLSIPDQEPLVPPVPWEFAQTVWALEGLYNGSQDLEEGLPGSFSNDSQVFVAGDQNELLEKGKVSAEAAKEAAQELKEQEKEAAEAAREAAQKLREEEKQAAEAAREAAQQLKEEEKKAAEAAREAAQQLKEEEKETAEYVRDTKKAEKEADKIEKQRLKDDRKKEK